MCWLKSWVVMSISVSSCLHTQVRTNIVQLKNKNKPDFLLQNLRLYIVCDNSEVHY